MRGQKDASLRTHECTHTRTDKARKSNDCRLDKKERESGIAEDQTDLSLVSELSLCEGCLFFF